MDISLFAGAVVFLSAVPVYVYSSSSGKGSDWSCPLPINSQTPLMAIVIALILIGLFAFGSVLLRMI